MFALGFNSRLYRLYDPPLDFHPMRQFHSALVARRYYYNYLDSVPEWKKKVAAINSEREPVLEPPIMEHLASFGYLLAGGEYLWVPRLLSSIFWMIGGFFIYLTAQKIISTDAAIVSTAYYLFLPFGIFASRSLQPDPMMIMMLTVSIFAIVSYYDNPGLKYLLIAAFSSASCFFIKPVCIFMIFSAFISIAINRRGIWKSLFHKEFLIFASVSLLPALIYNVYGIFIAKFLKGQTEWSFIPGLIFSPFFRNGWAAELDSVFGYLAVILAIAGTLMFRKGMPSALMRGLWIGYIIFGLAFNYHIASHSHYQLQLIPVIALCFGALAHPILGRLADREGIIWRLQIPVAAVAIMGFMFSRQTTLAKLSNPHLENFVNVARAIGKDVNHSTSTIFLTFAYGEPLEYYGELSGTFWPGAIDFQAMKMKGISTLSAEERFRQDYLKDKPEYFIVTDRDEFGSQPDLRTFLSQNFPVLAKNEAYLIFDLRKQSTKPQPQ